MKLRKITLERTIFKDKKADFLLAASVTQTCTINGITQAGIPGKIPLTPTLDAEFITTGKVFSLPDIAETPKGVPTPALITRAVEELSPFKTINILDLGLDTLPKHCLTHDFAIKPSASIANNANIDAHKIFNLGLQFALEYTTQSDYIILAESTPSGTTTAKAVATALGYETKNLFASSFKHSPTSIKEKTINASLSFINSSMDCFEKLGICADNMLIFNAGFVAQISQRYPVMLAGGTQMASVLLIINSLYQTFALKFNPKNIYLTTTKWIAEDSESNIHKILEQLSFPINAYYSDFDFSLSQHPALALYDQGEAKEGVGAGAAITYAYAHGISQKNITTKVEAFLTN